VQTDVEHRLAQLEARAEITELLHRYGAAVDYGDEAGWVDCFTRDAVFENVNELDGSSAKLADDHDSLARFVANQTRAPELYHKHVVIDPVIAVSDDDATCSSYFAILLAGEGGVPMLAAFGRYLDSLRRQDGAWKIAHRIARIESMSPTWSSRTRPTPG
jgi:hypothetical protein